MRRADCFNHLPARKAIRFTRELCQTDRLFSKGSRDGRRHAAGWKSVMTEAQFGERFRAELLELLSWRRDVRRFRPDDLPGGMFERLVEIACLAPSVGLSQPWRFVAVKSRPAATPSAPVLKAATPRRCDPRDTKEQPFTPG